MIYAEGTVDSLTQPDATDWVFVNNQGSPTDTVDSSGNLIDHEVWSPFGQLAYESNPSVYHLQGFSGGISDPNTGLVKLGERWYDPQATVWLSADPARFGGGDANLTRYVGNNTPNATDPIGLFPGPTPVPPPPGSPFPLPPPGVKPIPAPIAPPGNVVVKPFGWPLRSPVYIPEPYVNSAKEVVFVTDRTVILDAWSYFGCDSILIEIKTIDDIIRLLHGGFFKKHSLDVIVISGHGNVQGGVQSSGGGIGPGMSEALAQELGEYLNDNGAVIVSACGAGYSETELQRWANLLGRAVIATQGDVSNGVQSTHPWITVEPQFQDY